MEDSSYDIVPAAKHLRRHPRAPTTVQVVADDFDAITQDVDFETAGAELYPFDGVTEVPSATEYGRYMDEVSRRLQEMAVDRSSHGPSTGNRLRRDQDPTPTQQSGAGEPGRRVHMWLEEVARNGGGPSELGESTAQESSPGQRSCSRGYSTETGTLKPREIQNIKTTRRRSQSSISQSYRSERVYTPSELNQIHPLMGPQPMNIKRERRLKSPSPTRSERIYTMKEINALAAQKGSPPHRNAQSGTSPTRNRADPRRSPTVVARTRSTSTTSVEIVLASCQPSLLHIAPVLYSLGIKQGEHLRALARLREETRDREMKEEMLRKGVTVLEWAILMDKLQGF
ncbi:hypothetical protein SCLCIDRAFT_14779 [Scleroderma citrinum Foug A]|uniref:Uncharacterized protein n=1 Tax=Scleroderma citrinum Foug A TaxID=1036808 RepID=A0A0C3ALJ1_9AGAM|nr:hypothetical protein SCLCIDRAFT_14779 [Scleroderma citrinum Foug A]